MNDVIVRFLGQTKQLESSVAGAGATMAKDMEKAGDKASTGFFSSFADNAKKAAAAAGLAATGALAAGFASSISSEASGDKLAAQLGLSEAKSKELGKTAGELYVGAYGESLGQVNDAIGLVVKNVGGMREATQADLKAVTASVLDVATAFDQDLGATTRAVGQLVKTGMAKNATEALDIITVGFQKGVDKSEDFLDTLNEYGTQFRKLGIDGVEATGILSQGLQAGARDADIVADSLKEFSIRAIDGSETTAEGFKALGLDAEAMGTAIGKGGDTAQMGLETTLNALRKMEDPTKREAAAVALFGTQAEDLGAALFAIKPGTAVAGITGFTGKVEGAAKKMGDTLADNNATKIEVWKRKLEVAFSGVATAVGPVLAIAPALAGLAAAGLPLEKVFTGAGKGILTAAKGIGKGVVEMGKFAAQVAVGTVKVIAHTAAIVAQKAATLAVSAATKAWTAAQWLFNAAMAANPVGLIIIGITALIAIVVLLYKRFEIVRTVVDGVWQFMQTAWDAILNIVRGVFNWVKKNWPLLLAILTGPIGLAVLAITKNWDKIKGAISAVFNWIKKNWPLILAILTGPIGLAVLAITKNWDTIKNTFTAVKDGIKRGIDAVVGFFTSMPGQISSALSGLASIISAPFQAGIDFIRSGWNAILGGKGFSFSIPSWVPGVGGKGFDFKFPTLEHGGIVLQTGLAVVHEGERFSGVDNNGFGGTVIRNSYTIHLDVRPGADPAQTGRAVVEVIRAYERANGRKVLAPT